jgi:predicted nuclease with TOPRIM domain
MGVGRKKEALEKPVLQPLRKSGENHMTNSQRETQAHLERVHDELEKLRSEARFLQGEARLQADQHINMINDRIADLESRENSNSEVFGNAMEDIASAFKSAWHHIDGGDDGNQQRRKQKDLNHV